MLASWAPSATSPLTSKAARGPRADIPGLAGKPIESVEKCLRFRRARAVLCRHPETANRMGRYRIAIGYEKMRDAEGKMDGKLVGQALDISRIPAEREGKVYIFPTCLRK